MNLIFFFFFSKCAKLYADLKNGKKISIFFLLLEIMTLELVVEIYLNYEENTCDWQSTCYQKVLRLHI